MLKNWFRIFYIMLSAAGIILYIVVLAAVPRGVDFFTVSLVLGPLFFFIGTIAYNVCKFIPKVADAIASYIQLATGLMALVFMAIGARAIFGTDGLIDTMSWMHTIPNLDVAPTESVARWYAFAFISTAYFAQMIIFGIMPLFKGVQKTLAVTEAEYQRCCCNKPPVAPPSVQKVVQEIREVEETQEPKKPAKAKTTKSKE